MGDKEESVTKQTARQGRRWLVVALLVVGMVLPSAQAAASSTSTIVKLWVGNNIMTIGGIRQPIDAEGTKPVIVEGRTLVPIRAVIEAFAGTVAWEASTRKVTVSLGGNSLDLWIGKSTASLNGTNLPVDAANPRVIPLIMSGRTMLPLRFVSESLGIDVQYEATTKMITLTYTVETTPSPLSAPMLVSPADGSKFINELPRLSWLPATGADASRIQILSSGIEVHAKSNLAGADYILPVDTLADGTYTWRVSAHNEGGWGPWSASRSFTLSSVALPEAPSLLTPANQSTLSAGPATLTWTAVTDASAYRVRVLHGTDQTHSGTDIVGTAYTVPSEVLVAGSYSWQVGAYVGGQWSDWSASWTFIVSANAPSSPLLLTPADQSILDSNSVVLTWASVADADSYRIQILRDSTEVHAASGLGSTTYSVPSGVLAGGRYSWQAAAHGPGGWSGWSDAFLFEARAKLTTSDIAKYVDRMVLVEVSGFEDGEAFSASGSGFFISSDGKIVTNYHVIDGATQGTVTLNSKQKYDIASVLGYTKDQDLAVIQISGTGFPTCALGDSSKVAVGNPVVAIGSPLGIQNTVSEGIVSKLWEDGSVQITAPISPGSSGGALFNVYGEVIGVTTWKIRNGENMNLAIPADLIRSMDITLNITLAQVFQKEHAGAAILPAPVLVGPVDNSVMSTLTPALSWTAVPGATKYSVSIWVAPNVKPNLIDVVVTSTSYTVPAGLLSPGGRYGWTVCAGNSLGWGKWATVSGSTYSPAFTVQLPVKLATPVLSGPEEGRAVWTQHGPIPFSWQPVVGADHYELWIGLGLSGDESTAVYKKQVYGTTYSLAQATLTRGEVYTWSVRADNYASDADSSSWAADRHFAVTAEGKPTLLSPANYATVFYSPTLTWSPFPGANEYSVGVFRGATVDPATRILSGHVSGTSYTVPGLTLTKGETYCWYVSAWRNEYINGKLVIFVLSVSATYVLFASPY